MSSARPGDTGRRDGRDLDHSARGRGCPGAAGSAPAALGDRRRLRRLPRRQRPIRAGPVHRLADRPADAQQAGGGGTRHPRPRGPLLDLFLQLTSIALALAPVLLVFYLLARSGEGIVDRPGRQPAGQGPGLGRRAGRADRRRGPGPVPDRLPPGRRAERRGREPARRLVALPGAGPVRRAERHPGRSHRRRVPAEPAGPARGHGRPGPSPSAR